MYFQTFPEESALDGHFSRSAGIKAFAKERGTIVLKPFRVQGGQGAFSYHRTTCPT